MRTAGTILASDGDGGFVWPGHLGAFDAMYTLVKLLELRALVGIPLSEARAALPHLAYVTATEFCPWEVKGRVMRILLDRHRTDFGRPCRRDQGVCRRRVRAGAAGSRRARVSRGGECCRSAAWA